MNQVLVTGIGGFIAKWTARELLQQGYAVRGTVRDLKRAETVRETLSQAGVDVSRLSFIVADLNDDAGWAEAMQGCRFVQHLASPFPLNQPRDREALVPTAKGGALRVIGAALNAGVERVVMTSSIVAMMYQPQRPAHFTFSEQSWTDPEWPPCSAYIVSKTRAEQAAWDYVQSRNASQQLAVVNPGFVLGPALDRDVGSSLDVIVMMLKRTYPALPPISLPTVDVRDVAALHVAAMQQPEAGGRRLIAAADSVSLVEIAKVLKQQLGPAAARVPTLELPHFAVRLGALFDPTLKSVTADLGVTSRADTAYVTALTGLQFRPARDAALAAAESLIRLGLTSK